MIKNGFLRFCDDPEIACCKVEAELGNLRIENKRLVNENNNLRNELCLKCGKYHEAHNGACDGCRWK